MNNNQARRDIVLQWVRHRTFIYGGLTINRAYCLNIPYSPELRWLLKKGIIKQIRVTDSPKTSYTLVIPVDGVERFTLPECPICGIVQEWTATQRHKMSCPARY